MNIETIWSNIHEAQKNSLTHSNILNIREWFHPWEGEVPLTELLNVLKDRNIDTSLEIGLWEGGTHYLLKQVSKRVISIEIDISKILATSLLLNDNNSFFIHGDSKDPNALENVKKITNELDLIFIDGDHGYDACKSDHDMYIELLKKDGIMIFHDYNEIPGNPIVKYIDKLAKKHKMHYIKQGFGFAYYYK